MAKTKKTWVRNTGGKESLKLFELEVAIVSGMVTESFAKRNPQILRVIQIRGDQTLADLHAVIFKAFDRFESHLYEFQVGGKRTMDPEARRYVLPFAMEVDESDNQPAGLVEQTRIDSLGLKVKDIFAYWFDFGDDWWHRIDVQAIHDKTPKGRYPKIISKVGDSPPQYPDLDEEDEEEATGDLRR